MGACAAVLLTTAGDDPRSSAAAQLPATAVTSPPPGHDADPRVAMDTRPTPYCRLYCSIHLFLMSQVVKVRKKGI